MSTTVPAMKARMGEIDYFIISMKAQELASKVQIPKEMGEWRGLTLEERYQRELDYGRVRNQIAPYLAKHQSRFFGSVIVAAQNFNAKDAFEGLQEVATKNLPRKYKADAGTLGFLTFSGGEVLVPLDGQHRLKAIQFAVSGKDENGREISAFSPNTELANDDVTVILVAFELEKARDIFTHVNLNARKTPTGQNIVTNDDDPVAVLSREVANELLKPRLVKFTSNTLNKVDQHFTTLPIVYSCNREIILASFPEGALKKNSLPPENQMRLYRRKVKDVWKTLVEHIEVFSDAIADPNESGDKKRDEIRASNLLGKPVTQECLVGGFLRLTGPNNNMAGIEACRRLNQLPWPQTPENLATWDRVLWTGGTNGKVITKNRKLITEMVTYMAGAKLSSAKQAELLEDYRQLFPDSEREHKQLPPVMAK